jgi:thiamine-phosphate pyrophosphorylase
VSAPQAPADLRAALRLYCIADTGIRGSSGLVAAVSAALRGGVTCVQLRAKDLGTAEQVRLARALREICRAAGVPFVVNDRVDVALAAGANGVHVGHIGQEDMHPADARALLGEAALIGVSVASAEEARAAEAAGASYVSAGPMYETSTKLDAGPAAGVTLMRSVRAATTLPVLGIGGITAARASECSRQAPMACASAPRSSGRPIRRQRHARSRSAMGWEEDDERPGAIGRAYVQAAGASSAQPGAGARGGLRGPGRRALDLRHPGGTGAVFPFQATINVIAGVLLGPWYALLTAFAISVLRNAAGTGTFLAFPGLGLRRAAGRLRLPLVA